MAAKRNILVVEDNMLNRSLLREILKPGYDVVEAENGQEALARLHEYAGHFSLILLDIVMPVMDGYAFLAAVKEDAAFASIPVIVTTQNDAESEEVAALSCGAADFVAKPYKPQIILHRVANIIHLRETAALVNEFQYDQLTGLYSKAFFCRQVRERLFQNPDKGYDIICSDIVNFKLVNDIFGIATGDRLLRTIAQCYHENTYGEGICSHFHADQFACMVEHHSEYTENMFQDVCARINEMSQMQNVVVKWGIYHVRDRTVPVEQMCDRALLAARGIKGQYQKYFAYYDDVLRSKLLREQKIVDSMEHALADGQFEIYLQPKYRIKDSRMVGAEALVRWNHPEWGVQSPAVFVPLFERNGFITRLDQYVWDKACAVLRDWEGRGLPPLPISVNVSRADIYNVDLANILKGLIHQYQLPPSRLHLEITESAYTENPQQIIDTVSHMREMGFVIEMDDFGSGYSSLHMLHKMPVDVLKLDMQFIQSEPVTPVNQEIMRFIMNLAHLMELGVVAEGVETAEQLERLREIGCECVQGYYFAKPMPVEAFERLRATCNA
ncbi:putative bifunctional diguanylate cyclase/phosphodiesterase [Intestinibacillus massiliensis]|uniref:putative bifunctional diguanylate cyclase/phosphodiesterase n=1 Tax=Intestinibacillus massiliensis TaxID=1871029 RepID=UPI000B35D082|nr:EAL domain-containing response regulator [Intestinibacillus massiliensis]